MNKKIIASELLKLAKNLISTNNIKLEKDKFLKLWEAQHDAQRKHEFSHSGRGTKQMLEQAKKETQKQWDKLKSMGINPHDMVG